MKLTADQMQFVKQQIGVWLDVGYPDKRPTNADAWHSALLDRLLRDIEPLPEPPPRAFSYPWYELIETGVAEGYMDIGIWPDGVSIFEDETPAVTICQAPWRLIEDLGNSRYVVEWPQTGLRCELEVSGQNGKLRVI